MSIFDRLRRIIVSEIEHKKTKPETKNFGNEYQESFSKSEPSPYSKIELEYYANLEVNPGASFEEVRKSYKELAKKYHPDKFHNETEKSEVADQILKKINEAYNYFQTKHKESK